MKYTIDFQKTYKSNDSTEFGTTTVVVACLQGDGPYLFTFYENYNNTGLLIGCENKGNIGITIKIGEATIEELIDAYFNIKHINGNRWRYNCI